MHERVRRQLQGGIRQRGLARLARPDERPSRPQRAPRRGARGEALPHVCRPHGARAHQHRGGEGGQLGRCRVGNGGAREVRQLARAQGAVAIAVELAEHERHVAGGARPGSPGLALRLRGHLGFLGLGLVQECAHEREDVSVARLAPLGGRGLLLALLRRASLLPERRRRRPGLGPPIAVRRTERRARVGELPPRALGLLGEAPLRVGHARELRLLRVEPRLHGGQRLELRGLHPHLLLLQGGALLRLLLPLERQLLLLLRLLRLQLLLLLLLLLLHLLHLLLLHPLLLRGGRRWHVQRRGRDLRRAGHGGRMRLPQRARARRARGNGGGKG